MSKRSVKQVRRKHSDEFRRNAISMVEDQDYTTAQAARELGINQNLLRTWRKKYGKEAEPSGLSESDQEERRIVCGRRTVAFVWNATY